MACSTGKGPGAARRPAAGGRRTKAGGAPDAPKLTPADKIQIFGGANEATWTECCTSAAWLEKHGLARHELRQRDVQRKSALALKKSKPFVKALVSLYEKRLAWLNSASRQQFGVVVEDKIVIALDRTMEDFDVLREAMEGLIREQFGPNSALACRTVILCAIGPDGIQELPETTAPQRFPREPSGGAGGKGPARKARAAAGLSEADRDGLFQWVQRVSSEVDRQKSKRLISAVADTGRKAAQTTAQTLSSVGSLAKDMLGNVTGSGEGHAAMLMETARRDEYSPHGPNVVDSLAKLCDYTDVDAVYLVLGRHPRFTMNTFKPELEKIRAKSAGIPVFNVCNFCANDPHAAQHMKRLAQLCGGRYHYYDGESAYGLRLDEDSSIAGDDIDKIATECLYSREALDVLERRMAKLELEAATSAAAPTTAGATGAAGAARSARTGKAPPPGPVSIPTTRTQKLRESKLKGGGAAHSQALASKAETKRLRAAMLAAASKAPTASDPIGLALSSAKWLKANSLNAQKMNFYDAFKDVSYQTHENGMYSEYTTMYELPWADGSIRSMHLDKRRIQRYRAGLLGLMKVYNDRIRWLGTSTLRVFGPVVGDVVTIAVDTSHALKANLDLVKVNLKHLLEELKTKRAFNIVRYDQDTVAFQPGRSGHQGFRTMTVEMGSNTKARFEPVEATADNLAAAWEFIQSWECAEKDARNLLGVLEHVANQNIGPYEEHNVYILCAGAPDHDTDVLTQYCREALVESSNMLHCIAYNCHTSPQAVATLEQVALVGRGTFHVCLEQGTVFDHMHDDTVSWTMPLLTHIGTAPADGEGGEGAGALAGGKFAATTRICQVLTAMTLLPCDDSEGAKACACDSDNAELLRDELARAQTFLQLVDDILLVIASLDTAPRTGLGTVSTDQTRAMPADDDEADLGPDGDGDCLAAGDAGDAGDAGTRVRVRVETALRAPAYPAAAAATKSKTKKGTLPKKTKRRTAPAPASRAPLYPGQSTAGKVAKAARDARVHESRYLRVNTAVPKPGVAPGTAKAKSRRMTATVKMPAEEEAMSSKAWLKRYGLKAAGLDVNGYLRNKSVRLGPNAKKQDTCMALSPKQWKELLRKLGAAQERYQRRHDWLLAETRRVFGAVVEKNIAIAIDTSGSMNPSLPFLQRQLSLLIGGQVSQQCDKFNLVQFASHVHPWATLDMAIDDYETAEGPPQPYLIDVTDGTCAAAAGWVQTLEAQGTTNVVGALNSCLVDPEVEGVYLLSDGLPDSSTQEVLRHAREMVQGRNVKIHTISYCSNSAEANEFLQALANDTGGRYHQFYRTPKPTDQSYPGGPAEDADEDGVTASGTDLSALADEIFKTGKAMATVTEHIENAENAMRNFVEGSAKKTVSLDVQRGPSFPRRQPAAAVPWGCGGGLARSKAAATKSCSSTAGRTKKTSTKRATTYQPTRRMARAASPAAPVYAVSDSEDGARSVSPTGSAGSAASLDDDGGGSDSDGGFLSETPRATPDSPEPQYRENRAFVSNLPLRIATVVHGRRMMRALEEKDLVQFFADRAGVRISPKQVDLPWDSHRNTIKGFAYVLVNTGKDMRRVLGLSGSTFNGRACMVSEAASPADIVSVTGSALG